MPTSRRNAKPLTLKPKGLSDSIDGTNSFPGAMSQLSNLVPSPGTAQVWVARPAAVMETDFSGSGITSPAGGTALIVLGTRVYGMIASSTYPGKDEPFCYDIETTSFIAISGKSSANLPSTQPTSGDWQPPHMEAVGSYIVVTHPGFTGGAGPYFGWIDLSGFSISSLKGNLSSGSPVIRSINGDGTSDPILDGVQPGQTITGTGIPANTTVLSVANGIYDESVTGDTHTNTTLDNLPSSALREIGMYVTGTNITVGTYIVAVPTTTSVTLSAPATGSSTGGAVQIFGGGTITMSANASATNNLVSLSIAGGSQAAPQWAAGNTNVHPLTKVPKWVSQFNDRAYYAVGNAEVFSDSNLPLNVTNANQALTFGDDTDIICSAGLPLNNITTGGIIQALIVVKVDLMWQVTGDAATSNLMRNELDVSIGSQAPNTFTPTPLGLSFIAPDGLRIIDFTAKVSEPLGANGAGVSLPFINALYPSRMVSAFNQNVLRITTQDADAPGEPVEEFWLHFAPLNVWSGPHSFPNQAIAAFSAGTGVTRNYRFVSFGYGIDGKLFISEVIPNSLSAYIENGAQLSWVYRTTLLPDNQDMSQNRMGQTALSIALPGSQVVGITCVNEIGTVLDQISLSVAGGGGAIWGSFTWGVDSWGAPSGYFRQYDLPWTVPLIFKQASIQAVGQSQANFAIGNLYMMYQPLGYILNILGAA